MEIGKIRHHVEIIKGLAAVLVGHFEPDMKLKDPKQTYVVSKEILEHTWELDQLTDMANLSDREKEVFNKCIIQGFPNKQAGEDLFIEEKTIKFHLTSIYRKLGTNKKSLLIVEYYKNELAKVERDKAALQSENEKLSAGNDRGRGKLSSNALPRGEH